MDVLIGQTDCAGQLDAFYKAEHIRPHFDGHTDLAEIFEVFTRIYPMFLYCDYTVCVNLPFDTVVQLLLLFSLAKFYDIP
jgi:hypothetical protein